MKLFVSFILGSFMVGVLTRRKPKKMQIKILIGICLFVCIGYFFLHQI
jgi:biotin transporter BioY